MYRTIMTGFAALALMMATAAFANPGATASNDHAMHKNWQARHAAHMQKRLEKFKSELKITSQQESAWGGYVKAVKAMHPPHGKMHGPAPGSSPAPKMFKAMANRASVHADHARDLAAAVSTLYQQLSSSQQSEFDQHFERMRARMHHHFKRMRHGSPGHHRAPPAPASTQGA